MTAERWQVVKRVVADVLEAPAHERAAIISRACGGDAELTRDVESLVAAAASADANVLTGGALGATELVTLEAALGSQYEVLRPLGRGGMGAVYLARERALDRFVAIKVLRPDLAVAPDARERFRREARVAAQLSHPGILPLYTFGEVRGIWYYVMGYVRGPSLAERLRLEGRLSRAETHRLLVELAEALECAHQHGIVHRDLKPANILLDDETGRAVLADFGIAKTGALDDSLTATGAVIGTPHYMSPEQAMGSPAVDARSDIYSLGVVGYTLLAGREPFADVSADQLMLRKLMDDPPPLPASDLASVIMRCLARQPERRWPDARALTAALRDVHAGGGETLPEALRDLPTFGPYALLWLVGWTALALFAVRGAGDRVLLLVVGALVPIGLALHVAVIGRHGLTRRDLVRIACWPPEWWGMWWPRALRRPQDLWPRLPWPARAIRVVLSALFAALPGLVLLRHSFEWPSGEPPPVWLTALQTSILTGTAVALAGAVAWALGRGLTKSDAVRLLFGATLPSEAWRAPSVASLLKPAGTAEPVEGDAADHVRAIAEIVRGMPATAQALGARVMTAARQLAAVAEQCDAEATARSRLASESRLDQLTVQLSALEAMSSREVEQWRELGEVLAKEARLLQEMRAQAEELRQRRSRALSLLRALWIQLARGGEVEVVLGEVSGVGNR